MQSENVGYLLLTNPTTLPDSDPLLNKSMGFNALGKDAYFPFIFAFTADMVVSLGSRRFKSANNKNLHSLMEELPVRRFVKFKPVERQKMDFHL